MDLIFIYGAPGVGKLTVANELSALTGYFVFHNHVAIDMVRPIYGFGNPKSESLIRAVNLSAITLAAEKRIDMIFTYARPNDTKFIRMAVDSVESKGGRVKFVELKCDKKTLEERIRSREGSKYGKIRSKEELSRFERVHGPFAGITIRKGMSINTSDISARHTARLILKWQRKGSIG